MKTPTNGVMLTLIHRTEDGEWKTDEKPVEKYFLYEPMDLLYASSEAPLGQRVRELILQMRKESTHKAVLEYTEAEEITEETLKLPSED